jgi:RNA polymerase sigma-70 factor (ECF subfamily)
MMTDLQIINGCLKHDRRAQKILYEKYAAILMGICVRYATDIPEAEDILQDSLLKIYLNIGDYTGEGSFTGWMRRIVINTAITNYHKTLKHKHHMDIEEVYSSEAASGDNREIRFTAEEMGKVLKELPKGYRTVFNLYAIEGYKHKEIAAMLEIDVNTSKSQYSRARSYLQKRLGGKYK